MRSTTDFEPNTQLTGPPSNLRLTNWALRDNGILAWTVLACLVGGVIVAAIAAHSVVVAAVGLAAFFATTWRQWIPVEFEFGPRGIVETIMGRRRRISWSAVRSWRIRSQGIFFSPIAEFVPLAALRGLYVRWGDNRDDLIAIVNYYAGRRVLT